jgi:sirohydrochlorin ferrochelatase
MQHARKTDHPSRRSAKAGTVKSARRLLLALATDAAYGPPEQDAAALIAADLAVRRSDGTLAITRTGRAHLARLELARNGTVDPFVGQHLGLAQETVETADGYTGANIDATESPLVWLARRKGRDGRALIEPAQLQAGERLRADFTRAQMMPRTTSNWTSAVAQDCHGTSGVATYTDAVVAARERVRHALDAAGPEFGGLLIDVCCFLKGLEDLERERGWPPRSAKIVLQLGLDRLARHYGYGAVARGKARAPVRTWLAEDAAFVVE